MTGIEAIIGHLRLLYGEHIAVTVAPLLEAMLAEFRERHRFAAGPRRSLALDQGDVLLIAYGDQVREPSVAPLRTLCEFCEQHLAGMVSGIHLLPFYPFTSDDGFAVTDYFAVNPDLGTWDDVARLSQSFDLMFDAVFNHLSTGSEWFRGFLADDADYRDFFVTVEGNPDLSKVVRPRTLPLVTKFASASGPRNVWTTFSADQADLNFKNPRVLLAVLEALLFYAAQGARFMRLDAVAFLWKEAGTTCLHLPQTHALIQSMRAVLDEVAPQALLVTETNVPHIDNVSYFGDGSNEAQLVYNFALPPLVLHALLRGDATHLARWARTLVVPSDGVAFLNFLASHDGVGLNPARGVLPDKEIDSLVDRCLSHGGFVSSKRNDDGTQSPYELNCTWFDLINDPAANEPIETQVNRFIVSQAVMLALAGVPAVYFHSIIGSRNDRASAVATGMPRRVNRSRFERAELERKMSDSSSLGARVFARCRELLRARRACAAFHPQAAQEVLALDEHVFALLRSSPGHAGQVLCLHNLSNETVRLDAKPLLPESDWTPLVGSPDLGSCPSGVITLEPYQIAWLADTRAG